MVLAFETSELRALCENEVAAHEEFGENAQYLFAILAELDSAPTLADLPTGIAQPTGEAIRQFVVERGSMQITFVINQKKVSLQKSGELDSSKVMRVKVIEVSRHA